MNLTIPSAPRPGRSAALIALLTCALIACGDSAEAPTSISNSTTGGDSNTASTTGGATSNSTTGGGTSNTTTGGATTGGTTGGTTGTTGGTTGGGTTGPAPSCASDDDCADSLDCTTDTCGPDGFCVWEVQADACLINNVCRDAGAARPSNPCEACQPDRDAGAWTARDDGAACDDGDACTEGTTCEAGACGAGDAVACDDGNPCTADACEANRGCVFSPTAQGEPCDDGSACTEGDACAEGVCLGRAVSCDDGNVCTDDRCDMEAGCVNTPNTAPCDDGNACTADDVCQDGACVPGDAPNCDDGNICTIDGCDEGAGCFNLVTQNPCCNGETSVCDDGDPCTTDSCDPATSDCIYTLNTARCDDGSACTEGDTCAEGECVGAQIDCDDDNVCTDDVCNDAVGCVPVPLSDSPCDDGLACTTDEACVAGECVGDDSNCVCEPDFSPTAGRFTELAIGEGGYPGESLDLDDDPETCTPAGDCEGGINNSLGLIAGLVNMTLSDAVTTGSLVLLVEFRRFDLNPFEVAVYDGNFADNDCDGTAEVCDYLVGESLLDRDTCEPLVRLPATLSGETVTAGGAGTVFPFQIPLGGATLSLTLYQVRFEGTVRVNGDRIEMLDAVLAGAVRRSDLLAALSAVPEDDLPFPPDTIASLLDLVVVDDIDTNGDGEPDAASIGIRVSGLGANLIGVDR